MFNMKQVGKKIVSLRKSRNMTQTELADKMGVSFQAVSNWERGNSMPDISKLPQLAALFDCTVDELLDGRVELIHSAMEDGIQEYVERNEVSKEELEAAVPILKPEQVERFAYDKTLGAYESLLYQLDDHTGAEVSDAFAREDFSRCSYGRLLEMGPDRNPTGRYLFEVHGMIPFSQLNSSCE